MAMKNVHILGTRGLTPTPANKNQVSLQGKHKVNFLFASYSATQSLAKKCNIRVRIFCDRTVKIPSLRCSEKMAVHTSGLRRGVRIDSNEENACTTLR